MNIQERTQQLNLIFSSVKKGVDNERNLEIIPFTFKEQKGESEISHFQKILHPTNFCQLSDNLIIENRTFTYYVFNPKGKTKNSNAILLLHGLNERSWLKYLTWAEELALNTSSSVILFPIAFHINRTPSEWMSPRWIMPFANKRKHDLLSSENCSFFNLALSERLSCNPERFYVSGRESVYNIWQLLEEIKSGSHPLFKEACNVNIFGYSIGALLSQVLLIANPKKLLESSKLFTFCGGSVFEKMNGNAKDIMDASAFEKIKDYYLNKFKEIKNDMIEKAFKFMLSNKSYKVEREKFYSVNSKRIYMFMLKNDKVIPTIGANLAVGENNKSIVNEYDFPFEYSHQNPFPLNNNVPDELVYGAFKKVFDKASAFLS